MTKRGFSSHQRYAGLRERVRCQQRQVASLTKDLIACEQQRDHIDAELKRARALLASLLEPLTAGDHRTHLTVLTREDQLAQAPTKGVH